MMGWFDKDDGFGVVMGDGDGWLETKVRNYDVSLIMSGAQSDDAFELVLIASCSWIRIVDYQGP